MTILLDLNAKKQLSSIFRRSIELKREPRVNRGRTRRCDRGPEPLLPLSSNDGKVRPRKDPEVRRPACILVEMSPADEERSMVLRIIGNPRIDN